MARRDVLRDVTLEMATRREGWVTRIEGERFLWSDDSGEERVQSSV